VNEFEPQKPAARWLVWPGVCSGKFSWGGSLFLKCAVLGVGVFFVYWVGWPQPGLSTISVPSSSRPGFPASDTTQTGFAGRIHEASHVAPFRGKEVAIVQPVHAVEGREIGQTREGTDFIVDLNDGTSAELAHLPGIGAVLAGRIVAHRVSHGAFRRVEDLALVPGIGEKRLQQVRPFVGVREPSSESGMGS
jgi:competence ComEA-like helix-hairpin-helix protein